MEKRTLDKEGFLYFVQCQGILTTSNEKWQFLLSSATNQVCNDDTLLQNVGHFSTALSSLPIAGLCAAHPNMTELQNPLRQQVDDQQECCYSVPCF